MNKLRELWTHITDLFAPYLVEREIKEVDEWDGSASRFDSTEDYCRACLINVNPAAGNTDPNDWTQALCMLPVREPGDASNVFVDKAIFAVAGGRGIGAVEKPDEVPQDAWDSAIKEAAGKVIAAYEQMDSVAPDAIFELAGQEPPEERAISWGSVYAQVDNLTWDGDLWLHELYIDDDGETYAIASSEGKLYRATVTVTEDTVTLGAWVPVEVQHVPVSRGLTITRQENGRYRWAGVACTAVLNKDQEIDSTTLFDRFVERFEQQDRATSPVLLDFWHQDVFLGEVDYLARDGYTLVASGLFRDDEIGRAAAQSIQLDPDNWGQSISYRPMATPEFLDVGQGISFPVWEDGKLERIALLPRDRASAWFTTFNARSENMRSEILEALKKLVGEEQAQALAGQVDEVNERVAGDGLIAREAEDSDTGDTSDPAETTEPPEGTQVEREQEPEQEQEAATPPDVQVIRELRADQLEIKGALEALVTTLAEFVPDVQDRLARLEQSEQERREAWLADMPTPQARNIVRPRQATPPSGEQVDTSERVNQLLASKGITQAG